MEELFERKYAECEKSLYLIAFSYLHNSEDAMDCVQETALSAYKGYDKLRDKSLFKTWITRILINKAKDFIKKRKYTEAFSDELNIFSEITDDDMDILNAVLRLSSDVAIYINLRYYNDMTYAQMSKALRQSESTVKYRTKKALAKLKSIIEEDEG